MTRSPGVCRENVPRDRAPHSCHLRGQHIPMPRILFLSVKTEIKMLVLRTLTPWLMKHKKKGEAVRAGLSRAVCDNFGGHHVSKYWQRPRLKRSCLCHPHPGPLGPREKTQNLLLGLSRLPCFPAAHERGRLVSLRRGWGRQGTRCGACNAASSGERLGAQPRFHPDGRGVPSERSRGPSGAVREDWLACLMRALGHSGPCSSDEWREPSLHLRGEVMGGGSLDPGLVSSPEVIVWVAVGIFLFPSWDSKAGVLKKLPVLPWTRTGRPACLVRRGPESSGTPGLQASLRWRSARQRGGPGPPAVTSNSAQQPLEQLSALRPCGRWGHGPSV